MEAPCTGGFGHFFYYVLDLFIAPNGYNVSQGERRDFSAI
jgi:hypothetical protein